MKKILVLLAHPKFEHSAVNKHLISAINDLDGIQIRDLYELYPNFNIHIQEEQELLISADLVIWHHPIYWYSAPPLLKQWIDLVLEFGWAYGPGGKYLKGKQVMNVVSSGGTAVSYTKDGAHGHTLSEFLLPFKQTASLCNMTYLPAFHVGGTHKISQNEVEQVSGKYREVMLYLRDNEYLPAELDKNHNWLQFGG